MIGVPLTVRFFVAAGTAAALVGCSSGGDADQPAPTASTSSTSATSSTTASTEDAAKQTYLAAVNALCDALLPKVLDATDGGSTDVPAAQWVATWPAHKALLDGFDQDLAEVPVPPAAADSAKVMADYLVWATGVDDARIEAAQKGEKAWRAELAREADLTGAPELEALRPAGFADSCQAR